MAGHTGPCRGQGWPGRHVACPTLFYCRSEGCWAGPGHLSLLPKGRNASCISTIKTHCAMDGLMSMWGRGALGRGSARSKDEDGLGRLQDRGSRVTARGTRDAGTLLTSLLRAPACSRGTRGQERGTGAHICAWRKGTESEKATDVRRQRQTSRTERLKKEGQRLEGL